MLPKATLGMSELGSVGVDRHCRAGEARQGVTGPRSARLGTAGKALNVVAGRDEAWQASHGLDWSCMATLGKAGLTR
jgi:hypothetical protein